MKPITSIIIILIASAIISQLVYFPITKGLAKYYNHTYKGLTEIIQKNTPYDLIFVGSSRVHLSIDPKFIDSICHVNSYNAGREGGKMTIFKMILDAYLVKHSPPRAVVLTIDLNSFSSAAIFDYPQYYPFLDSKIVYDEMLKNGYRVNLIKRLPFLGMTDLDDYSKGNALKGLFNKGATEIPDDDYEYKGYLSNGTRYIMTHEKSKPARKVEISDTALVYFNDIIRGCKEKNIKLIFTYAPEYNLNLQKQVSNTQEVFDIIDRIAKQNEIPFFRHDSLSICQNPHLFANNGHLNKKGGQIYTSILATELKPLLSQEDKRK